MNGCRRSPSPLKRLIELWTCCHLPRASRRGGVRAIGPRKWRVEGCVLPMKAVTFCASPPSKIQKTSKWERKRGGIAAPAAKVRAATLWNSFSSRESTVRLLRWGNGILPQQYRGADLVCAGGRERPECSGLFRVSCGKRKGWGWSRGRRYFAKHYLY